MKGYITVSTSDSHPKGELLGGKSNKHGLRRVVGASYPQHPNGANRFPSLSLINNCLYNLGRLYPPLDDAGKTVVLSRIEPLEKLRNTKPKFRPPDEALFGNPQAFEDAWAAINRAKKLLLYFEKKAYEAQPAQKVIPTSPTVSMKKSKQKRLPTISCFGVEPRKLKRDRNYTKKQSQKEKSHDQKEMERARTSRKKSRSCKVESDSD
jgi:hypothetical protein